MAINHYGDQTSIDLLPPYGKSEITTRGEHADDLAFAALAVVVFLAVLYYF